MLPYENIAEKTGIPRSRSCADLLGAIETIISALVEMASGDSIASKGSLNYGDDTVACAEMAGLQPTILVCGREDGLTLVNRGRAIFARDYLLQLLETMVGLMAEGKPSLDRHPSPPSSRAPGPGFQPVADNCFRKKGMYWTIAYKGKETLVADSKGLYYLAQLLRYPGREIHVLDLVTCSNSVDPCSDAIGMSSAAEMQWSKQSAGMLSAEILGDAGALLDAQAKSAYKRRLTELREELLAAKQCGDERHALALEEEIEALVGELRRATGLRGRDRKAASATERARVNVTRTIKLALTRIGRVHMELENHLVRSIRTGAFCRYQPDPDELVTWCI
jgi:hypothetical protein